MPDPVAPNGQPVDYNALIAQAVAQMNPSLAPPQAPPALNAGAPLVPPQQVAQAVQAGMSPASVQPNDQDKANALMRIGTALMQPRMPGQSIAGNAGAAMSAGQDSLDRAKAFNAQEAARRAQTAIAASAMDTQRQQADLNMQKMRAEFPAEYNLLQEKLKEAALNNDTATLNSLKARILSNPSMLAQELSQQQRLGEANVEKTTSEAAGAVSAARYHSAMADYLEMGKPQANGKQNLHVQALDDGRTSTTYMVNGKIYQQILTPGAPDLTTATKLAKKQLQTEGGYGFFSGPTPKQISDRAQQLMTPGVVTMDSSGKVVQPPDETTQLDAPMSTPPKQLSRGERQIQAAVAPGNEVPGQNSQQLQADLTSLDTSMKGVDPNSERGKVYADQRARLVEQINAVKGGQPLADARRTNVTPPSNRVVVTKDMLNNLSVTSPSGSPPAGTPQPTGKAKFVADAAKAREQEIQSDAMGQAKSKTMVQKQFNQDVRSMTGPELRATYQNLTQHLSTAQLGAYFKKINAPVSVPIQPVVAPVATPPSSTMTGVRG